MKATPRIVSEDFMQAVLHEYPVLKTNSDYRLFTEYLLFGTYLDKTSRKLMIPSKTMATLLGKEKEYTNKHFSLQKLLQAYKKDVNSTLSWSNWKSDTVDVLPEAGHHWKNVNKKTRIVTNLVWSDSVKDTLQKELTGYWKNTPQVYFGTGFQWTREKELALAQEQREEALRLMAQAKVPEARELLELMNTAPSRPFHKIMDNINDAIKHANDLIGQTTDEKEKQELIRQLKLLNAIYSQKQPFYKPVDASTRIFSIGEGLAYLDRRLRKVLTQGWIECDLSNAQLAIAAKLWNVPVVLEFLKQGGNIWDHLLAQYSLTKTDETKDILKVALYSLMYGMSKKGVGNVLSPLSAKPFFKSPYIKAMYEARKAQFKKIKEDGEATTCFGQHLSMQEFSHRSVLAQLSQAYELKLLYPVVKLARKHKDDKNGFTITLWQHDGFSFVANRQSQTNKWIEKIQMFVNSQAHTLGIPTHFEVKSSLSHS